MSGGFLGLWSVTRTHKGRPSLEYVGSHDRAKAVAASISGATRVRPASRSDWAFWNKAHRMGIVPEDRKNPCRRRRNPSPRVIGGLAAGLAILAAAAVGAKR